MNPFFTRKAANLRRFLGIVLFAAIVGAGISIELTEQWASPAGWLIIVAGSIALIFWGFITARQLTARRDPEIEGPRS